LDLNVSNSQLRIEVVDNATDFAALRDEWNELLASSKSDSMFLTWEWLYTWWMHLGQSTRLFIITARSGSQLVAIAPLVLTRTGVGPLGVPLLESAGTGSIGSDYLDFIVNSSWEAPGIEALTSFLIRTGLSIRLHRVNENSALAKIVSAHLADREWKCVEIATDVCPFIDLSAGSWDAYLSTLRPSHRKHFTRGFNNLGKGQSVSFDQVSSEDARRAALRDVIELHLRRWSTRGGSDAFNDPNVLAFHEELSRLALERGWLRLSRLTVDGVAAAAFYGFRYGPTFHYYQSGFDPTFEHYSVGLVTIGLTIRAAIEEGAAEYDLLHGNEKYKFLWATQVRRLARLELYPPGLVGRMHRRTRRVVSAAKKLARSVLRSNGSSLEVPNFN